MKTIAWLAVIAKLLAHGWGVLVFLGAGWVIGNTAVIVADDDAYVLMALEAIAGILTFALAIQLLTRGFRVRVTARSPRGSPSIRGISVEPVRAWVDAGGQNSSALRRS